ncbi:hypothetical protein MJO29_000503 [Puccinia striiformis f. sp. tritici]|nr:hypothetical protein MJO29_000503 [Puccinia striiformis f. sp. tritici]
MCSELQKLPLVGCWRPHPERAVVGYETRSSSFNLESGWVVTSRRTSRDETILLGRISYSLLNLICPPSGSPLRRFPPVFFLPFELHPSILRAYRFLTSYLGQI